jgi:hypothetical protein
MEQPNVSCWSECQKLYETTLMLVINLHIQTSELSRGFYPRSLWNFFCTQCRWSYPLQKKREIMRQQRFSELRLEITDKTFNFVPPFWNKMISQQLPHLIYLAIILCRKNWCFPLQKLSWNTGAQYGKGSRGRYFFSSFLHVKGDCCMNRWIYRLYKCLSKFIIFYMFFYIM